MRKEPKERIQFNVRLDGRRELLEAVENYIDKYGISKSDFVACCLEKGLAEDAGAEITPTTAPDFQGMIAEALSPLLKKIESIEKRLGELKSPMGRKKS